MRFIARLDLQPQVVSTDDAAGRADAVRIAEELLETMGRLFGSLRGGLGANFFGLTNLEGQPTLVLSYANAGSVDTEGADIAFNYYIVDGWVADFSYSWFDFEVKEQLLGDVLLPNAPESKLSAGLAYNGDRFGASVKYRWVDDFPANSGVYVGRNQDALVLSNPVYAGAVSKKLLIDLLDARIPVELKTVALAARNAEEEHLEEMRRLLAHARDNLSNPEVLTPTNIGFHQQIAIASGNTVLRQILTVLSDLFQEEQRAILDIYSFWHRDHAEHVGILEALERHDESLAVERMRAHLEGVREVLVEWDAEADPAAAREESGV